MAEGMTRWLTYDDMATALGITPDSARRLATRHRWPRRPGNDGRALVAVPEERLDRPHEPRIEAASDVAPDEARDDGVDTWRDARALIGYLERRVDELGSELSAARRLSEDARSEARDARAAAEASRVQAGQVDVLTALVAAERAHLSEVRAERDRLTAMLGERRPHWFERIAGRVIRGG